MKRQVILPILAVGLAASGFAEGLWSDGTFVFTRPEESFFWRTATNASLRLCVPYPAGATMADLTVRQKGRVVIEKPGLTKAEAWVDVTLPEPTTPEDEGVYDLTLEFDAGEPLTASLAVVSGAGAGGEWLRTRCLGTSETKWRKIKRSAVLPIPYGTTSLTLNGEPVDPGLEGAAGWYPWGPLSQESVAQGASLTVGGETYGVDAFRFADLGLMLLFR